MTSYYTNFVKFFDMEGKVRWTNNSESAALILKKQDYVSKIMALRSLEINRKIIAANRKMEREGWSSISNEQFERVYGK